MLKVEMAASIRKVSGKGAMRQLRMQGITPAVVYGGGSEGLPLQLETKTLFHHLLEIYRKNAIVTLNLDDGSSKNVLVQDVQTDPIKDSLIHADFLEIDISAPRQFNVPVTYVGTPKGCDLGGLLNVANEYVLIEGTPIDIPDEITVTIGHLAIGEKLTVESLEIPGNVTLISDKDEVLVSVVSPSKGGDEPEGDEAAEEMAEDAAATSAPEGGDEG